MGEALQLMQEATQNMTLDGTTAAQMVTMGYNLARLQEASGVWGWRQPQLRLSQHDPVTNACSCQCAEWQTDSTLHALEASSNVFPPFSCCSAGDVKAASKAYQDLIEQFPGYIDCYLRLSALARAAGDMDKAREWADAATQQAGGDVDAQALLATIYLQRG